jgi:cytidine deaminase
MWPHPPLHLTPLRVNKIGRIKKSHLGSTALPIYGAAQLNDKPFGRQFCESKVAGYSNQEMMARSSSGKKGSTISEVLMTFDGLYRQAKSVLHPRRLSEDAEAGGVAAALLSESGTVYTGVCIDTACSMGFCAEHAAAAAMVTAGENRVVKMVAVNWDGNVLPPCGRCREFISQLHPDNFKAEVMVSLEKVVTLRELLPYNWRAAAASVENS